MSGTIDRRTTLATCFQRGALLHGAQAYLNCAREDIRRGRSFPVELVAVAVVGRLRSVENYVSKPLAREARVVAEQVKKVIKTARKQVLDKTLIKAVDAAYKSLEALDTKIQSQCQTFW